jgi:hypothetical protein
MSFIEIDKTTTLYDSLPTINSNSLELDSAVVSLKSRIGKWRIMYDFFTDFRKILNENSTFSQNNSSIFIETATLVEANSSTWLKPISIFYPSIFPGSVPEEHVVSTVLSWVDNRFPIFTGEEDTISTTDYRNLTPSDITITLSTPVPENPKYIEGQKLIVYVHRWMYGSNLLESHYLWDSTICKTRSQTICAQCTNRYYGYVYCSNGDFKCDGQSNSCQSCKSITCNYNTPPYYSYVFHPDINYISHSAATQSSQSIGKVGIIKEGSGSYDVTSFFKSTIDKIVKWVGGTPSQVLDSTKQNVYGQIVANVEMSFLDRNENSSILAISFVLEDCKWKFYRFI